MNNPYEFVQSLMGSLPDGAMPVVCGFKGDPKTVEGWRPIMVNGHWPKSLTPDMNLYIGVSSVDSLSDKGGYSASGFKALHFVMVDDIPQDQLPIVPSWVVESSPDNYQNIYVLSEPLLDKVKARRLCNLLAEVAGGDTSSKGPARWTRLPFGINGKPKYAVEGKAPKVTLSDGDEWTTYTVEEITEAFGIDLDQINAPEVRHGSEQLSESKIAEMLLHIDPDMGYDSWKDVLMAIHAAGGTFEQAVEWSRQGESYEEKALTHSKWESFSGDGGITARTLAMYASEGGWEGDIVEPDLDAFEEGEELEEVGDGGKGGSSAKLTAEFIQRLEEAMPIKLKVMRGKLEKVISSLYYDPKKGKFYALTSTGALNMYTEVQALKMIKRDLGYFYDPLKYTKKIGKVLDKKIKDNKLTKNEAKKEEARLKRLPWVELLDLVVLRSQRGRANHAVDMFAEHGRMEIGEHKVDVTYKWKPLRKSGGGAVNMELVEDYRQHFPEFDDLIAAMISARFAKDRKQAYVWLKCESDWGKSFLLSVLNDLGLSIEMSSKEVEKMMEGNPCGKTEIDFIGAFVAAFEEFKAVKSELKQLESSVSFSPKNASEITVQLYLKLFLSANEVPSLAGEAGVEDQFANRFSRIEGKGRINDRPLFTSNQCEYFTSIRNYVAGKVNEEVEKMVALGKHESVTASALGLREFHNRYGLRNTHSTMMEGAQSIAEEFQQDAIDHLHDDSYGPFRGSVVEGAKGRVLLKRPSKVLEDWLKERFPIGEAYTWLHLKKEILDRVDAEGVKAYRRADGKTVKALWVGATEEDFEDFPA